MNLRINKNAGISMDIFTKNIQNFIFHKKILRENDRIIIGISGGSDSVCLVRVLLELKDKYDLELSLLHVNYHQRGKDSDRDEEFVRKFAKECGVPIEIVQFENKGEEKSGNMEEKMRHFRYRQFEKKREEKEFDLIAVGHTLDDQAETVLMNLLRGCGSKGLGASRPIEGKVIRPLLETKKEAILNYLKKNRQKFCVDKSNFDNSFTRNRIRKELLPLLEEWYNPAIRKNLYNLSENIWRANEIVDECAKTAYNGIVQKERKGLCIKRGVFRALSNGLQTEIFRMIIEELKGNKKDISSEHFFEFKKIVESKKGKNQQIEFAGTVINKKGEKISFEKIH